MPYMRDGIHQVFGKVLSKVLQKGLYINILLLQRQIIMLLKKEILLRSLMKIRPRQPRSFGIWIMRGKMTIG